MTDKKPPIKQHFQFDLIYIIVAVFPCCSSEISGLERITPRQFPIASSAVSSTRVR
jgi:hypothetical protein